MNLTGRAVALSGAVTMPGDGGTTIGGCSGIAGAGNDIPTLSKWAQLVMGLLLVSVAVWVLRRSV